MPEVPRKYRGSTTRRLVKLQEGAVRTVRHTGKPIAQMARAIDTNPRTLGNWVARDHMELGEAEGLTADDR